MKLKDKTILVTGAGGFIGSHLVECLVEMGMKVRVFLHYNSLRSIGNLNFLTVEQRKNLNFFWGDITDSISVHKAVAGCDVVFHLAALIGIPYSYMAPESYVSTNVFGTLNVLQACLEKKVTKLVHTSTSEVYGTAQYCPMDEKHPLQGQSPYSASKIGADMLASSYFNSFALPVSIIRPFNTYGPRQSTRAVIPTIISQALIGNSDVALGALAPIRDFNYVTDVISAFVKIAETDETVGRFVNIGSGIGVSIAELVKIIAQLTGKNIKTHKTKERIRPDKSEVMQLLCNSTLAKEVLGWKSKIPLLTGLEKTIDFISQHIELYHHDIYNV